MHGRGVLHVRGIKAMTENDIPVDQPTIEFEYGSIFDLEMTEREVVLLLTWRSTASADAWAEHRIECDSAEWVPSALMAPET